MVNKALLQVKEEVDQPSSKVIERMAANGIASNHCCEVIN